MSSESHARGRNVRQRVKHELEQYLIVAVFLFFFFGSVTTYRRLVLAEYHIGYFEYGWGLVKALILAKVILIGELLHIGTRFERGALAWSILWKTLIFGLFILAFAVAEHTVAALIHGRTLRDEFQLPGSHGYELLARVQLEVVALLPLFAFKELARVLGEGKVSALLFGSADAAAPRESSGGRRSIRASSASTRDRGCSLSGGAPWRCGNVRQRS